MLHHIQNRKKNFCKEKNSKKCIITYINEKKNFSKEKTTTEETPQPQQKKKRTSAGRKQEQKRCTRSCAKVVNYHLSFVYILLVRAQGLVLEMHSESSKF